MPARILVIDDEVAILDLMRAMLGSAGYEVIVADNGNLGLGMFEDQKPDLVIVDIAMPEVNGYHVIDTIRKSEGDGKRTPIIVLTAFPESVINTDLDELGADLHLTKPISATDLVAFIKRLIQ